MSDSIVFWFGP